VQCAEVMHDLFPCLYGDTCLYGCTGRLYHEIPTPGKKKVI